MAARSRSVGRYDLVVEVAKSQLGPLWAATVPGAAGGEPRLVRCVALGSGASVRDVDALADVGRWSGGFLVEQAPSTLDVVSAGRDLALVTSYVPGETLRSLLRLAHFKHEPIAPRIALALTLDVCKALAAAEARALETARGPEGIRGGLLPDSIWVGADGTARVLDLGVASMWRRVSSEAQHPEVAAYSAPEQLEPGELGPSTDVFTLGILLWELLSGGKRLFAAASQRAVAGKLRKLAARPAELPDAAVDTGTRTLLREMLEPDPGARVGNVRELRQALEAMGNALASPQEVADFVTRFAATPLESRERALGRALARRPASEPPPRPTAAPPVNTARPEPPGLAAAKPLPLPAQVKLGGRIAVLEGRTLPPPPPARGLLDIDASANDDEETGSVRAEDILAALAVEDLEPATDAARGVPSPVLESRPDPAAEPDAAEPAVASAPISSGRRAPLTAVVVPSVLAGPDAPSFTPVPSVLQTLRGPGVPPLGSDLLGLAPSESLAGGDAAPGDTAPVAAAELPSSATRAPAGLTPARAWSLKLDHAVDVARAAQKRLPGSLVAAVGGTALLLVIALVSAAGGKAESSAEQPSKLLAAQRADADRRPAAKQQRAVGQQAPVANMGAAREDAPKPTTVDAAPGETGADDPTSEVPPRSPEAGTALAVAAVVTTPRVTAARPARRTSAAARATAPPTKKRKIRATRKYIPLGI